MNSTGAEEISLDPPVFDFYPEGLPPLMSPKLESVMMEALDEGRSGFEVIDLLEQERARQFRDDPAFRERVHDAIAEAGVTAINATMLSLGADVPHGWEVVMDDIRRWHLRIDAADWLSKALTAEDLRSDGVNVLIGMQSTDALAHDIERLEKLYDFGMRVVQLTYNDRTLVGDGCTERTDAGLSHFGLEVVEKLNELGMVVDLSHCGRATTMDTLEHSESPPAFTHVTCRDLFDHPRGKTDAELEKIAEKNGYVGIVGVPMFLGLTEDMEAWMDHFEYAIDIVGPNRIGVCTDWGFWTPDVPVPLRQSLHRAFESVGFRGEHAITIEDDLPPFERYQDWQEIPAALAERGYENSQIQAFCGGNFVDYFERIT